MIKFRRKRRTVGIDRAVIKSTAPYIIIGASLVVMGIGYINMANVAEEISTDIGKVWEEAYRKVESSKIGIVFDDINTTEKEYTALRRECNTVIDNDINNNKLDARLVVDTVISEEVYIDGAENVKEETPKINETMIETGPLYFQDMILLRYINNIGELKILTSVFTDGSKSDIKVLRQSELAEYKNKASLGVVAEDKEVNENTISELEYTTGIGNAIVQMIKASNLKELDKAEELAIKYFTVEGRKTVFGGRNSLKKPTESEVTVNYVIAGKSDTNIINKDRVYMQLRVLNDTEDVLVNIILKMNNNYRIFDIDII